MNINKYDISIILGMTIAVILMGFMFPSLGLAGDEVAENDIPNFSMNSDRFDFAGEFPGQPDELTSGEVNKNDLPGENFVIQLPRDGEFAGVNNTDGTWDVRIQVAGTILDSKTVSPGETYFLNVSAGNIEYRVQGQYNDPVFTYSVIEEKGYGGISGGIKKLVDIFFWGFGTIITIFSNTFGILYDVITFIMGMANWLISTYLAIVSNAGGFASIIVLIPGIALMMEMAKIGSVMVSILWIG